MVERLGAACSHCMELKLYRFRFLADVPCLRHRCDRPRYLCDCQRCKNQRENLGTERRKPNA